MKRLICVSLLALMALSACTPPALRQASIRGMIVPFDRAECPHGWEPHPGLEGRVVVGVNPSIPGGPDNGLPQYALNQPYGAPTSRLSEENLPAHAHDYMDIYYSEHGGAVNIDGRVNQSVGSNDTDRDNNGWQTARRTAPAGGGTPFSIQPPSRAYLFCRPL